MNQHLFTKHGSTNFLRLVILALGLIAVILASLVLPAIYRGWAQEYPGAAYLRFPILIALSLTIVPFFAALFQTLKLLRYVDTDKAFSTSAVQALKYIKYSAVAFSALYATTLPGVYHVADVEDAPGIMVIGLVVAFAPVVIAVFAAVLQKLLQSAMAIKSENDLTV